MNKNNEYNTIDIAPSRLRDTTYLLPVLGAVKKKSLGSTTHRDKIGNWCACSLREWFFVFLFLFIVIYDVLCSIKAVYVKVILLYDTNVRY